MSRLAFLRAPFDYKDGTVLEALHEMAKSFSDFVKSTLILLPVFLSMNVSAGDGPGCGGGGGGGFFVGRHFELLDLYNIEPHFESPIERKPRASYIALPSIKPFALDDSSSVARTNAAYHLAKNILNPWTKLPFDIISNEINHLFDPPIQWLFTDHELKAKPFFIPKALAPSIKTSVAAFYQSSKAIYTVEISRRLWNQMDALNQAALLIHESLRHLQIGFGNAFNDESLQKATAVVVLCKPSVKLSQYVFYMMQNHLDWAEKTYGDFSRVTASCGAQR